MIYKYFTNEIRVIQLRFKILIQNHYQLFQINKMKVKIVKKRILALIFSMIIFLIIKPNNRIYINKKKIKKTKIF